MGLFRNKQQKTNRYEGYPTENEYRNNIKNLQEEELNSERYKAVIDFLNNDYRGRANQDLENRLFTILNLAYDRDENLSDEEYMKKMMEVYNLLMAFIKTIPQGIIDSNVYLKKAVESIAISEKDCLNIIQTLMNNIKNQQIFEQMELCEKTSSEPVKIEAFLEEPLKMKFSGPYKYTDGQEYNVIIDYQSEITPQTRELFVDSVNTERAIKYYRPEAYRNSYVPILDYNHIQAYHDFNEYSKHVSKIIRSVYLLQLYNLINKLGLDISVIQFVFVIPFNRISAILCYHVKKQDNKKSHEEYQTPSEEFINSTIENFKKLVEMGFINPTEVLKEYVDSPSLNK